MSDNLHDDENGEDPSYREEPMQRSTQDSPLSPASSDEEDEELEEELMYYQIAMEAKAEIERIKTKVNDEFIFKKPLHPAPRAKNRSKILKKTAISPAMVPLCPKKVVKKRRYYYIETKYTPLPPLVPINQEANDPQPSKTYLFDPSKMPREKEEQEKYYNPYIPTTSTENNSNARRNKKSSKTDFELYGDPFGPGTSKSWKNWPEDEIPHNNYNKPTSIPSPSHEDFVSYGHYTQCLVKGCGCTFYYQAPDYSPEGGKKIFYIIESTDQNVNGKIMTLEEQRHYVYFHKEHFVSMKKLEWEYEPNNIGSVPANDESASEYVEAVLGPVPHGTLYEPSELSDSLDREYYLFKYFEDIQSPSSSSDED